MKDVTEGTVSLFPHAFLFSNARKGITKKKGIGKEKRKEGIEKRRKKGKREQIMKVNSW